VGDDDDDDDDEDDDDDDDEDYVDDDGLVILPVCIPLIATPSTNGMLAEVKIPQFTCNQVCATKMHACHRPERISSQLRVVVDDVGLSVVFLVGLVVAGV
jgi:hypothetical protein